MSTAHRVIKNTGFLYAKMGITMFISLYTTRIILNALGTSDFGIFNVVGGAIAMLGFLNGAMASATQRFMSYSEGEGDKEKQKRIFNISFILHFAIAILMGAVLLVAGWFFFNGILNIAPDRMYAAKVIYGSLIVSTIFTVMTVPYDAVLNAHENMLYYSIVGVIESVLKLAAALAVVSASGDKLILYGILMACIPLFTMTAMRIYCHKKYEECIISPRKYYDKPLMKEMRGFAGWNLMTSAVSMVGNYGQGIILNVFFGTKLNATQGISNQLNGQLQVFSSNMLKALNPILGKSAGANDTERLKKATFLGAKYSTLLFVMVALPVFIYTPYIMKVWLKFLPEWTIIFVRFQLIKTFIEFQFGTIPRAIGAKGKIRGYSLWNFFFNILQLPLIYLFFKLGYPPYFMYVITIIFGNLFVYGSSFYFAKIYCQITLSEYLQKVTFPIYSLLFIFGGAMYLQTYLHEVDSLFSLGLTIVTYLLFFIFYCFYLVFSKEEQLQIQQLKSKLLNKRS